MISDEIVKATQLSEDDLRREIAVLLFAEDRLTLGQASNFAGMRQLEFQQLVASRGISVHYDVIEFRQDLRTLDALHNS